MEEAVSKTSIINDLESELCIYDKIIIVDKENELAFKIIKYIAEHGGINRIKLFLLKENKFLNKNLYRILTKSEMTTILAVYRMYEFSNRVTIISENDTYGHLFNYVETGILTEEEAIKQWLYS